MSCAICTEDFSDKCRKSILPCCQETFICQDCLYSHIKSIIEEGITGDGRKELKCPFGCGAEIPDHIVRSSMSLKHWSIMKKIVGRILYYMYLIATCINAKLYERELAVYTWLTKSRSERLDLQLYEKWSLTIALSSIMHGNINKEGEKNEEGGDANEIYTHVIHCPRADCQCCWLMNKVYRKRKLANERAYNKKQRPEEAPKGFTKSLILSASGWLFFKPLKPEVEEEIMDENGYTTLHWLNSNDIDLFKKAKDATGNKSALTTLRTSNNYGIEKDGRRVFCPGCEHQFCALCNRPWSTLSRHSGARISHTGKLCSVYGRKIISKEDDDYVDMADAGDARCCPSCSIRTNRTEGCNHITCPCGYEWCYVCGSRWNSSHYACRDGQDRQVGSNSSCIIS